MNKAQKIFCGIIGYIITNITTAFINPVVALWMLVITLLSITTISGILLLIAIYKELGEWYE